MVRLVAALTLCLSLSAVPVAWENYLDGEGPEAHGFVMAECGTPSAGDGPSLFMVAGPVSVSAVSGAGRPSLVVFDRDMTEILASGDGSVAYSGAETVIVGIDGEKFHATFTCIGGGE
jgi:hypothetical protein